MPLFHIYIYRKKRIYICTYKYTFYHTHIADFTYNVYIKSINLYYSYYIMCETTS